MREETILAHQIAEVSNLPTSGKNKNQTSVCRSTSDIIVMFK